MKTQMTIISIIFVLCLMALPAVAQIPRTINYQGSLSDAAGVPLNESVSMHFALFAGPSGGDALWSETHPDVAVKDGIYSVLLGSSTPLNLAFDTSYYLEVSVGGGGPLAPRHALSSAPYALNAAGVDGLTVENGNLGIGMAEPPMTLSVWGKLLLFTGNAKNKGWQVYTIPGGIADEDFSGSLSFHENTNDNYTGVHRMVIQPGGNVGIGTTNPQAKLHVTGALRVDAPSTFLFHRTNESGMPTGDGFRFKREVNFFGQYRDALVFEKTDGNDPDPDGGMAFVNTGNDGIEEPALVIRGNGNIGVKTMNPTHELTVNGTIRARNDVIVDTNGANWPDYVFDEQYALMPLEDVSAYIDAHRHLPGVPTRQEVADTGVPVGEMQATLLQKVEELTLHTIALNEENERLRQDLEDLKARLSALE